MISVMSPSRFVSNTRLILGWTSDVSYGQMTKITPKLKSFSVLPTTLVRSSFLEDIWRYKMIYTEVSN
ncbi:unnamed protein product [Larinioides sclopetarius]|uniref:Uncharacterized protein n=1 Tax=Larinioides sclopetarius TaxID=280406 RepID=A0AAV1Z135_9ARAC